MSETIGIEILEVESLDNVENSLLHFVGLFAADMQTLNNVGGAIDLIKAIHFFTLKYSMILYQNKVVIESGINKWDQKDVENIWKNINDKMFDVVEQSGGDEAQRIETHQYIIEMLTQLNEERKNQEVKND